MDRVDEDTFLIASLAHNTAQGINKDLVPNGKIPPAMLDHRTILGQRIAQNQPRPYVPPVQPRPPTGYTQQPVRPYIPDPRQNVDVRTVPLIDSSVNSIPLNGGPPPLLPMPRMEGQPPVPDYHSSPPQNENNSSFSDFVIPQFGNESSDHSSQHTTPMGDMSTMVMLQQFQSKLDEIYEIAQENTKKMNRIERKLNQLIKLLTPTNQQIKDD